MAIQVRKATLHDAEGVIALLDQFYPGVPHHWRQLFTPRSFTSGEDYPGLVIVDEERVVGFLGTVLSDHDTSKGRVTVCNLSCWYVEPAYRQHGLKLFLNVMKLPGIAAWTNLTAAPHTYEWLHRSGYMPFVDKQTVIFPLPALFSKKEKAHFSLHFSIDELNPDQRPIYQQHQLPHCKHVLIKKGEKQCYCIIVVTRYKRIPLANLYYISHPDLFQEVISDIRLSLCWQLKTAYLVMEGKSPARRIRGSYERDVFPPRMFKSTHIPKEEITLLGSELFVLGI